MWRCEKHLSDRRFRALHGCFQPLAINRSLPNRKMHICHYLPRIKTFQSNNYVQTRWDRSRVNPDPFCDLRFLHCTSKATPLVQVGGRVKMVPYCNRSEPLSVLRIRADCGGRLFTAKLGVVVHCLSHQLLDHLLTPAGSSVLRPSSRSRR